ncbi:two-component sensor histidine kinase [Cellulomonas chitinilytica]|uniref:histidine kinase n=1 Tax=Cellulomonas chitinilytica TaxID=398759 RepID=A0A919U486_9CELL|nr:histidine kinase [Cellulomonas chitinilytica]GIG22884.1 two-component sensor histidine kinase [Cellulomonas chitinilytica]
MTRWDRLLRWEEAHRFVVDAVGTAFTLLLVVPFAVAVPGYGNRGWVLYLTTVLLVAPLAWRRVRPTASVAAVYTVALLQMVFLTPLLIPADLTVPVALYSVTVHGPRWAHRVAVGGALLGSLTLAVLLSGSSYPPAALGTAIIASSTMLTVWAFGLARRSRRETIEALVDRAQRLEVERDQQTQIATAAERARIARDLHDIVAHSLSVVIAQADGGRYAAEADPAAATRALATIGETGRAALTDMRRLLGVLRAGPGGTGGAGSPGPGEPATATGSTPAVDRFAPQPSADDIGALVDQVRGSGVRVSLVRMGTPRRLPPGMGLAVYRIAQEALTNVLKHAGPDPQVTVMVSWQPEAILVEVDDDGRGASAESDGLGQGMLGMRERATMFGGTVTAGPRPGGGFRVRAQLPTPRERTSVSTSDEETP